MLVKDNKVLAQARAKLKRSGLTTKPKITAILKKGKGKGLGLSVEESVELGLWCGLITEVEKSSSTPKKKAPVKRARVKKKTVGNNQSRARPNNGGARVGGGRKKGAATKKTRAIADKLAESNETTPLEYMLQTLRETPEKLKAQYDKGEIDTVQYSVALQDLTKRRDKAAETAACYIHPRLSSIEANVGLRGQDKFVALMLEMDKADG